MLMVFFVASQGWVLVRVSLTFFPLPLLTAQVSTSLEPFSPVQLGTSRQLELFVLRSLGGSIGGRSFSPSVTSLSQSGFQPCDLPAPWRMLPQTTALLPSFSTEPFVPRSVSTITSPLMWMLS